MVAHDPVELWLVRGIIFMVLFLVTLFGVGVTLGVYSRWLYGRDRRSEAARRASRRRAKAATPPTGDAAITAPLLAATVAASTEVL